MLEFSLSGISLAVFFDTRRMKAHSVYPVKYRLTYRRQRQYFPSGIDVTAEKWAKLKNQKEPETEDVSESISIGFERLKRIILFLVEKKEFSMEKMKDMASDNKNMCLKSMFEKKIYSLTKRSQGETARTFICTLASIKRYKGDGTTLYEISEKWLRDYETFLLSEGKSGNTIKIYTGCIRSIMNDARTEGKISDRHYPFGRGRYMVKPGTGKKAPLTVGQVSTIMCQNIPDRPGSLARDLWFFSYLASGMSFGEMLRLRYRNIAFGEITWSRIRMTKAGSVSRYIVAPLLPEMREIIDKWGNADRHPDSLIFPFLNDKMEEEEVRMKIHNVIRQTNRKMNEISRSLGLPLVSTVTARHSYADILRRRGVSFASLAESLGHADQRTTENYLLSLEQEERIENALKLISAR